ncbi:uncharacterized protein K452DRAFT_357687 [Aplosporella prunicola CBS 121167]|uniref:RNA-dependent RNA polymerase n=1 Tax=Aplosporella prunicola CBS 121167 TaxID=1176127 RepID=A0A6A6BKI8_9PEZI|nr:uncharacterized protein K452DRAFT_357687 [Aplosporella prunicola CBS 121167]KAF2143357.1 hypothetical protein K452DRAFT_357687 [Aplosporella prunicola CBS 121167]
MLTLEPQALITWSMRYNQTSNDIAAPTTPGRAHDKINDIVTSLETDWQLGLTTRARTWSPSLSGKKSDVDKALDRIKFLFYQGPQVLKELLDKFEANAGSKPNAERLRYLNQLLECATPKGVRGKSIQEATSLPEPQGPESGRVHGSKDVQQLLRQASTPITRKSKPPAAPASIFNRPSTTEPDSSTSGTERASRGQTRGEPPSPLIFTPKAADEDGHFTTPPQSPSLAASMRKQSQLSSPEQSCNQSQQRRRGKRSPEESGDEPSPKHCRTSEEDTSDPEEFPFAVPKPLMAKGRAHQDSSASAQDGRSAATSFTSTTGLSRSDSVFSQYRDNTTTANTSFTTNAANSQEGAVIEGEMFHSSGTVSLDTNEALLQAVSKFDPPSNNISPGKKMEHHQIKNLTEQGLFVPDLTRKLKNKPFKLRWEFVRIALANGVDPEVLLPHDETHEDYDTLWEYFSRHPACHILPRKGQIDAWKATGTSDMKLKASLSVNSSNSGLLFELNPEPLRVEESCRFQRAFGGDRFLYLEIPPLNEKSMPNHLKKQDGNLSERIQEWLLEPKDFLGRTWKVFHYEDVKKKKSLRRPTGEIGTRRVVLFAESGIDIPTKSVGELIHWFMPLHLNAQQTFAKAYARLSLGLTTTKPGLVFKPSQVRFVRDAVPDDTPEYDLYRDPDIEWPFGPINQQVMNDGCARISVGAAMALWRSLRMSGPLPSAYQGRIGGAKGVWMLSAPTDTQDPDHRGIWIEVTDSQLKFEAHKEDLHDSSFDPHRLTFDLHSWTDAVSSSSLYISFVPILENRGVPAETLQVQFRRWINDQNKKSEERTREVGDIMWLASMPCSLHERVVYLLETGFSPNAPVLAASVERLVAKSLKWLRQSARIPLAQCVYLKGVADPTGTLEPGEIHLYFSQSLSDDTSGEVFTFLDNRAVLVARNPALRRSDIQKVRASFKIGLTHLRDVVVFSSKGSFPLAGKLQGGDYDGDDFWVCWDPRLVQPFRNAPAPMDPPNPESYRIKVDKRKLRDVLPDSSPSSIDSFLKESFQFRERKTFLGVSTKLHEKVAYYENSIESENTNSLADIHHLLVDGPKGGLVYDEEDYELFQKGLKLPKKVTGVNYQPAYKVAQKEDSVSKYNTKKSDGKIKYNPENIMDKLYFETIKPHTEETLEQLSAQLCQGAHYERALLEPYIQVHSSSDSEIELELERLTRCLVKVYDRWMQMSRVNKEGNHWGFEVDDADSFDAATLECHKLYKSIMPSNTRNATINGWTIQTKNNVAAEWDYIKASTLWKLYSEKHSFVFYMAGRELSFLKCDSFENSRFVVQDVWASMKPRKIRKPVTRQPVVEARPEVLSASRANEGLILSETEADEEEGFMTAPEEDEEKISGDAAHESAEENEGPGRQLYEELSKITTPKGEPRRSRASLGSIPKLTPRRQSSRMQGQGKSDKKRTPTLAM